MSFRRAAAVAVSALLAGSLLPAPEARAAEDEDSTRRQLEEVRERLERQKAEQEQLRRQAGQLNAEVEGLREQLVRAAAKVQDYEESLSYLETRLSDLQREEAALRGGLEARNEQMAQVLTALQRLSWRPKETLLMQPGSPEDTVRSALLMRSAVPALSSEAQALRADLERLHEVEQAVAAQRAQIASLGAEFAAEHDRLQGLVARKATAMEQTSRRSEQAARQAQTLAEEAETMREFLEKLAEERRRREEELKRQQELAAARAIADRALQRKPPPPREQVIAMPAAKPAPPPASAPESRLAAGAGAGTGAGAAPDPVPAPREVASAAPVPGSASANGGLMPPPPRTPTAQPVTLRPLRDMRGAMPLPARGRVATGFGDELSPGNTSKGVVIDTRAGATVVAPADGIVAFSGPFRGYGHLLILEHADGYHTLLSGMEQIDAQVGQRLLAGEPVGIMDRGDSPALYVELRRGGQPIDPLPWMAASKGKISG